MLNFVDFDCQNHLNFLVVKERKKEYGRSQVY